MTTPLILNVVTVSTKHLLDVYHCQQNTSMFTEFYIQNADTYFTWLLKYIVSWGGAKGHFVGFGALPKGHIRGPNKGHSALLEEPSENLVRWLELGL